MRFTREAHGDPLADQKALWERAEANLPVRQGYVLATDNGRAEVEFENGAMAFLNENTVFEFYDLSLQDGARITRLVLRQGSGSFYVNPSGEDYFSVTGGDFTVEANGKSSFRMNNFDDGSNVALLSGRAAVLHKKETTALGKGQSLSMKAGEDSVNLGHLPEGDDFDQWVSGRIDTVSSATSASLQYTNSASYAPGFADLYTYGAWSSCGGYGLGWRPFGAGFAWSPFTNGQWLWDPGFGWTFASFEPWGWAPYHYGGWLFDASCGGWFYSPPGYYGFFGGVGGYLGYGGYGGYGGYPIKRPPVTVHPFHPIYNASTAVFVRQNGVLGIVPRNPLDKDGKSPLNLEHGVFSLEARAGIQQQMIPAAGTQKWETVKSPSHDFFSSALVATTAPERTSRSMLEGSSGTRIVSLSRDSSIVYDPIEHRFVNTRAASPALRQSLEASRNNMVPGATRSEQIAQGPRNGQLPGAPERVPASARAMAPPPAPRSSGGGGFSAGNSGFFGGDASSRGSFSSSASSSSHASSSSASSGGGRPH